MTPRKIAWAGIELQTLTSEIFSPFPHSKIKLKIVAKKYEK